MYNHWGVALFIPTMLLIGAKRVFKPTILIGVLSCLVGGSEIAPVIIQCIPALKLEGDIVCIPARQNMTHRMILVVQPF